MSDFHISAQDIYVENGHILRARLTNESGDAVDSSLDLNQIIGNNDGHFEWGGVNFSETAENISFSIEGGASVPVLRARLQNLNGDYLDADINLAERISNDNGEFRFI